METSDVEYVPGSHLRWDTEEEYRIRLADGQSNSRSNDMPGAVRIHQQPGDAVAFEALGCTAAATTRQAPPYLHAYLHLGPRAPV